MHFLKERILALIYSIITGLVGFWMWRYYRGWGDYWIRFFLTGVIYVIFWCMVLFFFWPQRKNIVRIPVVVFIVTCFLEFLQLWKVEFLQQFRATLIGAALIGTDFVWLQFPYYVLGALVSMLLLRAISSQK